MKQWNSLQTVVLALLMVMMSCEKENNEASQNTLNANELREIASTGSWVVTYFFDTDEEDTANFNGYQFNFNQGGQLVVTNGTQEVLGTWSISDTSNSDDDFDESDVDFTILFTSPVNFQELSDDWDVVTYSETKIELIDISGGNGGTDRLTFERN